MKKVAIIIPCFNEETALPALSKTLSEELGDLGKTAAGKEVIFNVIFINDGSSDGTQSVLDGLVHADKKIHFVELASNAGHQAALRAGLMSAVDYDAAVMMDADLQHPPRYINEMLSAWNEGYKIVQMVRGDSAKQAGKFKYATSRLYYALLRWFSGIDLVYGSSDFRLIDRSVLRQVSRVSEPNLFLRGYFASLGVKTKLVPYVPDARVAGESKYTFKKMLLLAKEGVIQFSVRPLYISIALGALVALAGLAYGAYLVVQHYQGVHQVSGWSSLMVALLFLSGINFILLGIIGLYLAQNIRITRGRPDYIIARTTTAPRSEP